MYETRSLVLGILKYLRLSLATNNRKTENYSGLNKMQVDIFYSLSFAHKYNLPAMM